jgi:hypothetical protein
MKKNGLSNDEEEVDDLPNESQENNFRNYEIIKRIKSQINEEKDEEIEETKSKKKSLNKNEQREISQLLQKIKEKDKEIAKLKEEILSQNKKNEESIKKINQLKEELKLVQAKLQNYNKKLAKSKSKEKYSINVENKNSIKFNKLFSEDEKKALSTLFKSEEELYNFNNKISILEDRNTKIENELKEQNKQLIKQINDKDEKIKVLEKGNNNQIYINENNNNIEFLKKEIDMLKSHKFFVLKIQKQLKMNYFEGKINIDTNFNDGKKHKKKEIKIKKIKKKE